DRAEAWFRIGVLAALLVGGPLAAIGAGQWAYHTGIREATAQAARLHSAGAFDYGEARVRARWQDPDGARHTGEILAAMGLPAGRTVTVWLNSAGKLTGPPLQAAQITSRAIAIAALTPAALAVVLLSALLLIRCLLDRRRLAAWDAAWLAVGPRWTRHGPGPTMTGTQSSGQLASQD